MSDKVKAKNHVQIGTLGYKTSLFSDIIEDPETFNEHDEPKLNNATSCDKPRGITIKFNKKHSKGE